MAVAFAPNPFWATCGHCTLRPAEVAVLEGSLGLPERRSESAKEGRLQQRRHSVKTSPADSTCQAATSGVPPTLSVKASLLAGAELLPNRRKHHGPTQRGTAQHEARHSTTQHKTTTCPPSCATTQTENNRYKKGTRREHRVPDSCTATGQAGCISTT